MSAKIIRESLIIVIIQVEYREVQRHAVANNKYMEDYDPIKLPKNADPDKYSYSGYAVGFDVRSTFSLTDDSGFGKNVAIFGVRKSSSMYINNKKINSWLRSNAWVK